MTKSPLKTHKPGHPEKVSVNPKKPPVEPTSHLGGGSPIDKRSGFKMRSGNSPSPAKFFKGIKQNLADIPGAIATMMSGGTTPDMSQHHLARRGGQSQERLDQRIKGFFSRAKAKAGEYAPRRRGEQTRTVGGVEKQWRAGRWMKPKT